MAVACSIPNCPSLATVRGRCAAHATVHNREAHPNRSFYASTAWQSARYQVLSAEPLCRICQTQGRITAATEVDHIRPISDGGSLTDAWNLQPLCKQCHSRKTRAESGYKFNPVNELR